MAYQDQPLASRMRWASNKRDRYHSDEAYRLKRINEQRILRGVPTLAGLAEMQRRGGLNRKAPA